jgi:hypothetical protein
VARHGGPTSHNHVFSGITLAQICTQNSATCCAHISSSPREAELNIKTNELDFFGNNENKQLVTLSSIGSAYSPCLSWGNFMILASTKYWIKIILEPSERKTNKLSTYHRSSRNTARTSEALSKASLNHDTTILTCIVRVISLKNQAYQRTDHTVQQHSINFHVQLYGNDDQVLSINCKMFSNPIIFNRQRGFNQKMVPKHYKMSSCLSTCIYDAKSIIVSAPLQVQASRSLSRWRRLGGLLTCNGDSCCCGEGNDFRGFRNRYLCTFTIQILVCGRAF